VNSSKKIITHAVAWCAIAGFAAALAGCSSDDKAVEDAAAKQHQQMQGMGSKNAGSGPSSPSKGRADMSVPLDNAGKAGPAPGAAPH